MLNIFIDRGGTFTDIYYQFQGENFTYKLLSEETYEDGVIEGIQRILIKHQTKEINKVVIGTTIITNAILERKGYPCALLITKGFRDLLQIGQQTRPKIFDLTMKKPEILYQKVIEIDERITHDGVVLKQLCLIEVEKQLKQLHSEGITSIAVLLLHSPVYSQHEKQIEQLAKTIGFCNISISCEVSKIMKAVPRGLTAVLDAYVNPLIQNYISKLKYHIKCSQLLFMSSDGGLIEADQFIGSKALLSGPAGGVVGLMRTTNLCDKLGKRGVIGLDMGGTSTDVCVYYNEVEIKDESKIDGIIVNSPCFDIETVAAGGGSLLYIENGLMKVGPQSSGAKPGPICYGRNGLLSLTDANLYLGTIDPQFMPNIFGPNNDEPLNRDLVKFDSKEMAEGFIRVADEQMCRPIRSLTAGRGRKTNEHLLFIYGGAGGQHCCQIADILDIDSILIHRHASIFSAYGLSFAREQLSKCTPYVGKLDESINQMLTPDYQPYFHLKYEGTDCLLKIQYNNDIKEVKKCFEKQHERIFGFTLNRDIIIEYVTEIKIIGDPIQEIDDFQNIEDNLYIQQIQSIRMEDINNFAIAGPSLIHNKNTTIKVNRHWIAQLTKNRNILLKRINKVHFVANPMLQLSLFANRFMSIAEEMGKQLQNTSISTNIKERLDFSCALFDQKGNLIANAPHLPVHLGSMSDAVKCQIENFNKGDIIISNHPQMGGSHLPDITAISPYFKNEQIIFFVASRGHHADIGGISPGSMPPFSNTLKQEGVAIKSFKIVKNNQFQEQELIELLSQSREINDNLSDLKAQIAANNKGIQLLQQLIEEEGEQVVLQNMSLIQDKAQECVQNMLYQISINNKMKEIDSVKEKEYMDDGSTIQLNLTINRQNKTAIFDFDGTSSQVFSNINCPKSVTKSAIIYCLRSLVDLDIPLNQGCLNSVSIQIPKNSLLDPSESCAIVGGNVLTSQRITDLILKCFKASAASQGCMNNFSFGGHQQRSYYETIAGGSGAGPTFNGESGVQVHMTNTRITDVEVLERRHPLRVTQFTLRRGSGGNGKFRGGDGVVRGFEFLEKLNISLLTERRVFAPFGLCGGENGERGLNILIRNDIQYSLGGKVNMDVDAKDQIIIYTPGGGGYGQL